MAVCIHFLRNQLPYSERRVRLLDAPIRRITSADAPMHYAPNLAALAIPDVERTVKLVKEVMNLKK